MTTSTSNTRQHVGPHECEWEAHIAGMDGTGETLACSRTDAYPLHYFDGYLHTDEIIYLCPRHYDEALEENADDDEPEPMIDTRHTAGDTPMTATSTSTAPLTLAEQTAAKFCELYGADYHTFSELNDCWDANEGLHYAYTQCTTEEHTADEFLSIMNAAAEAWDTHYAAPLYERLADTYPDAEPVHGSGLDSICIPHLDGYLVATTEADGYLLGIYPAEVWEEGEGPVTFADIPRARIASALETLTEPPEGVDWLAWAQQYADDQYDADTSTI